MMYRAQEPRPPTVVEGRVTRPSDPKVGLFIISSPARNAEHRILNGVMAERASRFAKPR